jgi:hypothetical protein
MSSGRAEARLWSGFGETALLNRTQEVAGSSPASSMKGLQTGVFCFLRRLRRAPGGSQAFRVFRLVNGPISPWKSVIRSFAASLVAAVVGIKMLGEFTGHARAVAWTPLSPRSRPQRSGRGRVRRQSESPLARRDVRRSAAAPRQTATAARPSGSRRLRRPRRRSPGRHRRWPSSADPVA